MNVCKRIGLAVIAAGTLSIALAPAPCQAQLGVGYSDEGYPDFFAGKGKAAGTNASYYVASAKANGIARVENVYVRSESPNGRLRFYNADNSIVITNALAAGLTNILLQSTNTLVAGDLICIRGVTNDTYQVAAISLVAQTGIILTNTFGGALTATCPTDFALFAGDLIYRLTEAGAFQLTTGTNTFTAPGAGAVYSFQEGRPGVVLANITAGGSTNSTAIELIAGKYSSARRP
jgi:hypothetical protein